MFKNLTHFLSTVTIIVGFTGCTSAPTVTTADIPLVHSSLAYSLNANTEVTINIPKANILFDTNDTLLITVDGANYKAKKRYISATGNKCIRFSLDENVNSTARNDAPSLASKDKFTSCERDGVWVLINPLVAIADI